jgi:hypothetical protein
MIAQEIVLMEPQLVRKMIIAGKDTENSTEGRISSLPADGHLSF